MGRLASFLRSRPPGTSGASRLCTPHAAQRPAPACLAAPGGGPRPAARAGRAELGQPPAAGGQEPPSRCSRAAPPPRSRASPPPCPVLPPATGAMGWGPAARGSAALSPGPHLTVASVAGATRREQASCAPGPHTGRSGPLMLQLKDVGPPPFSHTPSPVTRVLGHLLGWHGRHLGASRASAPAPQRHSRGALQDCLSRLLWRLLTRSQGRPCPSAGASARGTGPFTAAFSPRGPRTPPPRSASRRVPSAPPFRVHLRQ